MAVRRQKCWVSIILLLSIFKLCKCTIWTFEIERFKSKYDVIPNDFGINAQGHWIKLRKCQKSCHNSTTGFNTDYLACLSRKKCCNCGCPYSYSTFRMGATARSSYCVKNEVLRSDAGCEFFFQSQGSTKSSAIPVLDLEDDDNNQYVIKPPPQMNQASCRCDVFGKAQYWHDGEWKNAAQTDLFNVNNNNQNYFKWKETDNYEGRIMRQSLQCNDTSQRVSSTSCIIFKVLGTLQYRIDDNPQPTTMQPVSISTVPTTKQQNATPTTARVSTHETTSKISTILSSVQSTMVTQPTHVTTTSHAKTSAALTSHTPTPETKYSTPIPDTTITEKIPTETSKMPVTELTEQSTTETDVVPGKKGARGASSDSDNSDNTLVITAIGAAAAIACVIIICIFLWFVVKRKRNNRSHEACSTDMTVITNATGMNNASSAPAFKNPICDAVYSEPTGKHHPKQLPKLGNPVYDKAIVNNNNKKGHQNTTKHTQKPNTKCDSNHYDNKDEEEAYDNPAYQDLVMKRVKTTVKNADSGDSTYDNTYAEPEKPIYEALSGNNGRDLIYQPLVHNNKGTDKEQPEYLTLLNESTSPEEQSTPEYLTLVGDDGNQTQPEYDYAFLDGQEKRTTLKAPKTRGAGMSQQGPHVYNGPKANEAPVYDVLEDPNNQGPPVYDVLVDPNNQGPPVYDVLEDPNNSGPPVYDVLEGPDSGDDYLMPADGK